MQPISAQSISHQLSQQPLSLGTSLALAHGVDPRNRDVVVCGSFVTGPFAPGRDPVNLLPDPSGDAYLNFSVIPTLRKNEKALCLRVQPGMLELYVSLGLLRSPDQVLQVDPDLTPGGAFRGYPATDPLKRFEALGGRLANNPLLFATFPGAAFVESANRIGAEALQAYDPEHFNNKALFRRQTRDFGYTVLPGIELDKDFSADDIAVQSIFGKEPAWLKLSHGSGGDLVLPINQVTREALHAGLGRLRAAAQRAFLAADFPGHSFEDFWPAARGEYELTFPRSSRVVLEKDAASLGQIVINGSSNLLVARDGTMRHLGYFCQNTGADGSYQGSQPYEPARINDLWAATLADTDQKILHSLRSQSFVGYVGYDYFGVRSPSSGRLELYCVELNGRPTMSAVPLLSALRYPEHPAHINVNMEAPSDLLNAADFVRCVTVGGENLMHDNSLGVRILPLALRSLYVGDECAYRSPRAKILVVGASTQECQHALNQLRDQNGIVFR